MKQPINRLNVVAQRSQSTTPVGSRAIIICIFHVCYIIWCLFTFTYERCSISVENVRMCTAMGKRVVPLPSKLMYGILSGTLGRGSIGFLQRQKLSKKKSFPTRSNHKHEPALINQMCISLPFPLQWLVEHSLVDARRGLLILLSFATEHLKFFHSSADVKRGTTKTMECGSFDRRSRVCGSAEAALFRGWWLLPDCWGKYITEITAD